jgi:hypothetical protein
VCAHDARCRARGDAKGGRRQAPPLQKIEADLGARNASGGRRAKRTHDRNAKGAGAEQGGARRAECGRR